jgi:hypothetical protein
MPIDPERFGVSFSVKQCRNFGISPTTTLNWLIKEAGFRRFRLMSYWNEIEAKPGHYDFEELDRQIAAITKANGVITLCLGARQPRWPENHWPEWAWCMSKSERTDALMQFVEIVVNRYKNKQAIISYQLENEALLENFGERPEVDRERLRAEYTLVKALDPKKPIIMSTSTTWGIPVRKPIPDIVGFSYYQVLYNAKKQKYTTAFHTPLLHKLRSFFINLFHHKPSFIHELQLEPWGPTAIWKMPVSEQDKSMGAEQIGNNVQLAQAVNKYPVDLWGGEWWYWRHKQGDESIWNAVKKALVTDTDS